MQIDDMELFSPSILNTPLIMPTIDVTAPSLKQNYNPLAHIMSDNGNMARDSTTSASSSATNSGESSFSISSADVKVAKIEDELKQSLSASRKPTASPFQKMAGASTSVMIMEKNEPAEDNIPSTADVVSDLESYTTMKFPLKQTIDSVETSQLREAPANETNMGVSFSPKKKFLYRSQSQTEPNSPTSISVQVNNNNHSQSQSSQQQFLPQRITNADNNSNLSSQSGGMDDDSSMDDDQTSVAQHFTRATQELTHQTENNNHNQRIKLTLDNGVEQSFTLHLQPEHNGLIPNLSKQAQPILINNKRSLQQAFAGATFPGLSKPTSTIIPPLPMSNEVTSSDQSLAMKRQKAGTLSATHSLGNFRPTIAATIIGGGINGGDGGGNGTVSDDQRKKQIRDSNREAARRCRERRRQHIEQLEGNMESYKLQMKQVVDKLARSERENTQLRAIISEIMQRLQPGIRLSLTERIGDLANVVATVSNGVMDSNDFNQQSDGGTTRVYTNNDNM